MSEIAHIRGQTFHGRKGEIRNAFRYSIDYVLLDAEAPIRGPWLFSRAGRNLAQIRDRDHGGPPGEGRGPAWARQILESAGVRPVRLSLLAQPRLLGHIFNPVSFWLAFDRQNRLLAAIAEVTNTYGDRHSYLCQTHDGRPLTWDDEVTAQKILHVSPFQEVTGDYRFRFRIDPSDIAIRIDYGRAGGGLLATLTGPIKPLTSFGILRALLRRPFGSRRVLALIHWQALKLWWKGARFRSRPKPPEGEVSQ